MANNSNNNDPKRDLSRLEDNPFIAFRRYADSQVSSLLNTVFTLPAQIANYNNVHRAREQCLFGKADPQKCQELQALDEHAGKLRHEGANSYRAGDVQAVLEKSEQLMKLEQQAGELRKVILSGSDDPSSAERQRQLIEKVANKKGQQWSDSWDWPEPAQDENSDDNEFGRWVESRTRRAGGEIERMLTRLEEDANKVFGEEIEELRRHWATRDGTHRHEDMQPRAWSQLCSWQRPSPADTSNQDQANSMEDQYSPAALEADRQTKHMGSLWRDAFEDLMHTTQEHPLLSDAQNAYFDQMGLYPLNEYQKELLLLQNWKDSHTKCPERTWQRASLVQQLQNTSDEPSYEYAHDHGDQHDDPPTPKPQQSKFFKVQSSPQDVPKGTETELDAYERLLVLPPASSVSNTEPNSTILSTMTTTERITAHDGTVTTKIVLKKRFADGSEQSSETVHTQRSQDAHQTEDPLKVMQNIQSTDGANQKIEKKGGWFWSS